jgi:CRP-like cAMP-binding protein
VSGVDKELLDEVRDREKKTSETPREMLILERDLELRPLNPRRPSGSHNAMYFFLCGYQHRLRGNFNHAVVACTRAISLDAKDYRPYVNRAYALVRLDRRAAALKDLEAAAALNAGIPENLFNLGLGYQRNVMHAEAVRAFTQCLEQIGLRLCPPWTEKRRLDAVTYLTLRRAVYKSRAMSLRQEREYHLAALDMIKSGGAQQLALKNGLTGSYQRALRRGAAAYFDCAELYGHEDAPQAGEPQAGGADKPAETAHKDEEKLERASAGDAPQEKDDGDSNGDSAGDRDVDEDRQSDADGSSVESSRVDGGKGIGEEEVATPEHDTIWHRLARETRLYPSREHSSADIDELAGIAHQVQLLSTLPKKHLRRICAHMGVVELQKDEAVFYQGSVPHCLYLVLHGGVSVYLHEKFGHADAVEKEERQRIEREKQEREEAANMAKIKATGLMTGSDPEEEEEEQEQEQEKGTVAAGGGASAPTHRMPMSWEAKAFLPTRILEPVLRETQDVVSQRLSVLDAAAVPTVDQGLGRFLVTLHAGSSFGEQGLVVEDPDGGTDKRRNASCVAESHGVVLLTVSKEDFNRVVRTQLMQEVKEVEAFLRSVALFSMVTSNECMHNLATYAETRHYDVDDVIVAEGTVQEEGIFLVRHGKCEIVAGLPLHDHKSDMEKELHRLIHDAAQARDPIRRKQYETMIQKLKTEMELLAGGGGSGGVSRRFTVKHNPEESYDYRRMAAFAAEIEQSTRRKCWNCNDKGKIIDMKEKARAGSSGGGGGGGGGLRRGHRGRRRGRGTADADDGADGASSRSQRLVNDILDGSAFARMDKAQVETARRNEGGGDEGGEGKGGATLKKPLQVPNHEGEYFVRQKRGGPDDKPIALAELVPRDTFGFESVFSITAQNKVQNTLTGRMVHVRNHVSLVAKTKVDVLFVAKKDFFNFTTFKTRQTMRKKLMDPKLAHLGAYSRIFKDPGSAVQRERIWAAYKKRITEGFDVKHAKLAQFM